MFDSSEAAYPKESRYREPYEKFNLGWDEPDIVACERLERKNVRGVIEDLAESV